MVLAGRWTRSLYTWFNELLHADLDNWIMAYCLSFFFPLSEVCPFHGPWEALTPPAIRVWNVSSACGRVCRADGKQRRAEILYREGWEGLVVAAVSHVLQQTRPPSVQVIWPALRETHLRHRGDRGFWPRVGGSVRVCKYCDVKNACKCGGLSWQREWNWLKLLAYLVRKS